MQVMDAPNAHVARRRSGWAGVAGVAVALGLTELFAGLSTSVPSAISAIGSFIIDISPSWLKNFAISAFGTADKAVLAIGIVGVALLIGWYVGKASAFRPFPIVVAFGVAAAAGIAAQLGEVNVEPALAIASTLIAVGSGLGAWYGIVQWTRPQERAEADDDVPDMGRRRLMVALAGAATVSVIAVGIGRSRLRSRAESQRAALTLPEPIERQLDPTADNDFGLALLSPIVISNATFYRIDTALLVPQESKDTRSLLIHGIVYD